jgi:N-acetylglutamate synthase-like GNAT family acetyltransferase
MSKNTIEIIPFSQDNELFIKTLNVEWLEKYFYVEPSDILMLSNPKEEIIDKGGKIFYAKYNNQIVGTFSLLKIDATTYELSKMAVTEKFQGFGIGNAMIAFCIAFAKENGIKKLLLFSNTILNTAIKMYKKHGFIEIDLGSSIYKRSNIKMKKII